MSAADSSTVDWRNWMLMTPAEQAALWRRYKAIIKAESQDFNAIRMVRAMNEAAKR
jgi:predicted Fe-S protein YdhL (DUF1289 family)